MWYVSHHLTISITKADIEVMSSISYIDRVIEETFVFYVIGVTPSNYFYN